MKRTPKRLFLAASGLLALILLGFICRSIDLPLAARHLGRIGIVGCAIFLANILLSLGGPLLGWHLLMRSVGIPVRFGTSVASFLMGRACNLISPMSYFGGESVRTVHIAAVSGSPKRQVLATIVVSEFQMLAGLTLFTLLGLGIAAGGSRLEGIRLAWAMTGGIGIALFLMVLLGLSLGEARPTVRILDLLIRCRIFPRSLAAVRESAIGMEQMIRSMFVERRSVFLLSQLASLLSPVLQFFRPTLFFALLGRQGPGADFPTLSELSVFFALSQLLFMLPSTPGGLGVYEGGVIGLFGLLGWEPADGAAYGLLLRLDDVVYVLFSFGFVARFGMSRWFGDGDAGGNPKDPGLRVEKVSEDVPVNP
jgi:uncharacterized protein (TIRG00374 family)